MRTTKARFRWNLLNQLFFMPLVARAVSKADYEFVAYARKHRPKWARQFRWEAGTLFVISVALLAVNWQSFILFWLIPHFYATWGIVSINYLQHDGCEANDDYNHSRNLTGPVINFLTFGNGFHGAHHLRPTAHWSTLKEIHEKELAPFCHPELNQKNSLAYMFKAYIWPGKRLRYDGTPMKLEDVPPRGKDEVWFPNLDKLPKYVSLGAMDDPAKIFVAHPHRATVDNRPTVHPSEIVVRG